LLLIALTAKDDLAIPLEPRVRLEASRLTPDANGNLNSARVLEEHLRRQRTSETAAAATKSAGDRVECPDRASLVGVREPGRDAPEGAKSFADNQKRDESKQERDARM
jgi:endonuclease YncB( thermonuclease family)